MQSDNLPLRKLSSGVRFAAAGHSLSTSMLSVTLLSVVVKLVIKNLPPAFASGSIVLYHPGMATKTLNAVKAAASQAEMLEHAKGAQFVAQFALSQYIDLLVAANNAGQFSDKIMALETAMHEAHSALSESGKNLDKLIKSGK